MNTTVAVPPALAHHLSSIFACLAGAALVEVHSSTAGAAMIILRSQLEETYFEIKRMCAKQAAHIFVTPDCDSVCACRVLTMLFQQDHVPYAVRPVANYSELAQAYKVLSVSASDAREDGEQEPWAAILINCGGRVPLDSFLTLDGAIQLFVLDSHRPYSLENVRDENQHVMVVDDGAVEQEYPQDSDLESESSEDSEGDSYLGRRRRKGDEETLRRQEALDLYYSGSFYGTSIAMLMYTLAGNLGRNTNEMLWCSILGLTDQFLHNRVSSAAYLQQTSYLRSEVASITQTEAEVFVEDDVTITAPRQDGTLECTDELQFFMLRHWTLYNSIYHSNTMASKLGVWREPGKARLKTLFAKMGIPLKESSAPFAVMKTECREKLQRELQDHIGALRLRFEDITFSSFVRQKWVISASDAVFAVCAHLDVSTQQSETIVSDDSFWKAYDSLKIDRAETLKEGIQSAIRIQEQILDRVSFILQQKRVICPGPFRYALLDNLSGQHTIFSSPLALLKLAHFLREAYQVQYKKPSKPFVFGSLNAETKTYLVVGVSASQSRRDVHKNPFARCFRDAVDQLGEGFRVRHDGFEDSIIEVPKEDMMKFLNVLLISI